MPPPRRPDFAATLRKHGAAPLARGAGYEVRVLAPPPGGSFDADTFTFEDPGIRDIDTPALAATITTRFSTSPREGALRPAITDVSPDYGPIIGGSRITVSGSGFATGAALSVAGVAVRSIISGSPNQLNCRHVNCAPESLGP